MVICTVGGLLRPLLCSLPVAPNGLGDEASRSSVVWNFMVSTPCVKPETGSGRYTAKLDQMQVLADSL